MLLTDFGLVRPIDARTEVTRIGSVLGTLSYMAPEVLEGGDVDGRSDQYSLACVLYECLAGHVPFSRDTDAAVLLAHLTVPPPNITDERPDLPARFDAVVAKGMAKTKEDRYGSCVDLIDDALAALTGSPSATQTPPELATEIVSGRAADPAAQAVEGAVLGPPTPAARHRPPSRAGPRPRQRAGLGGVGRLVWPSPRSRSCRLSWWRRSCRLRREWPPRPRAGSITRRLWRHLARAPEPPSRPDRRRPLVRRHLSSAVRPGAAPGA